MDSAPQWAQGTSGVVKVPMEGSSKPNSILERKTRPQKDQALNCPRCNSTNTKFCYYNNYSLSQPRYFCKTCRRYWTDGGSLRNVPVGGGSRKNKRSSITTASTSTAPTSSITKKFPDLVTTPNLSSSSQSPEFHQQGQDLNLAYPPPHLEDHNNSISKFIEAPSSNLPTPSQLSAMELLKTDEITLSRGLSSFTPIPIMSVSDSTTSTMFNSSVGGFSNLQDFKPGFNFFSTLEAFENNGYGGQQGNIIQEGASGARVLFPVEDLKQQVPSSAAEFDEQNRRSTQGDNSTGYWNGLLGGGSW